MITIDSEYARLKALAEAATPGKWQVWTSGGRGGGSAPKQIADLYIKAHLPEDRIKTPFERDSVEICGMKSASYRHQSNDAAFIASAHDMMALIERLIQERKRAHSALEAQRRFRHDLSICGCQGCIDTRALLGVVPVADAGPTPFAGRRTDRSRE